MGTKQKRNSEIRRKTSETDIELRLDIDGRGMAEVDTGIPFFDHMLSSFARHGGFDLFVSASGDIQVGSHHLVEDVGICLGKALGECIREKRGIKRFAHSIICMDDAEVTLSADLGGRSYLRFDVDMCGEVIKGYNTAVTEDFFRALVTNSFINLHIKKNAGLNSHHIIEAVFKALGITLHQATRITERGIPSTKGTI
ncbi:MAG: imidazoleglycerol-phosphate dehydratase HisB [Actinomycetota bacterium]